MSAKVNSLEDSQDIKSNEKKWGKTLMKSGWTAFPSVILEKQHALGLTATDINIILYLSTHWWEAERKPYPSKKTIAQALGVTPRTVQKRIAALEEMGFVEREYRPHKLKGNDTNIYHFNGLIKAAEPYAQEKIEEVETAKEAKKARRKRIKPVLKGIDGGKSTE
ncbi:helix-turn-helix domain-containing protein [Vibrio vulnificus]|uniref:helix-turn-helix domain-containing protein n=1 Tax=Vibrio vulnificus TaxID=672 RepID=UPI0004F6D1B5|nr:helix-turn-helix domain-containing protein [Vibrio vulnificus]AIL73616.1 AsnC family transcriptional regulator [Vibrio vulnificus]EGQ7854865.1 HTH domain-containing protein [Vibrio vulnificus]EIA1300446.1 helix-turn-helix domain-containing protein [Vibrio vulnificus]EIO3980520.1 helix-turn-helix domain-containing protein [Vibrio vulnificus]EIZ4627425.1 helix-turn-helix domain-containing protein [Vibrio vulnificus]